MVLAILPARGSEIFSLLQSAQPRYGPISPLLSGCWGVKLIADMYVVLRLRMSGVVFPLLLYALMVSQWMEAFTVPGETVTLCSFYSV
jgi:hypothetical protein